MATSMKNQTLYLQQQTSKGVAATAAMKRHQALKMRPAYRTEQDKFRGAGSRFTTAIIRNSEMGAPVFEAPQDFNGLTPILQSVLGKVTPTVPGGATKAKQWKWAVDPYAAIDYALFTAIWGDATKAWQLLDLVFTNFGFTFNRGQLSFDVGAISKKPTTGATLPATGVVDVPAAPIPARGYRVFMDSTWATLGTTRLLGVYEGGFTVGETYVPDWTVNDLNASYDDVVEAEETDYTSRLVLRADAAGVAAIGDWENDVMKFLRVKTTGPLIEAGQNYSLQLDMAVKILNPGEIGAAPNSPTRTIPFDFEIMPDPTSGKALEVTLINQLAAA